MALHGVRNRYYVQVTQVSGKPDDDAPFGPVGFDGTAFGDTGHTAVLRFCQKTWGKASVFITDHSRQMNLSSMYEPYCWTFYARIIRRSKGQTDVEIMRLAKIVVTQIFSKRSKQTKGGKPCTP